MQMRRRLPGSAGRHLRSAGGSRARRSTDQRQGNGCRADTSRLLQPMQGRGSKSRWVTAVLAVMDCLRRWGIPENKFNLACRLQTCQAPAGAQKNAGALLTASLGHGLEYKHPSRRSPAAGQSTATTEPVYSDPLRTVPAPLSPTPQPAAVLPLSVLQLHGLTPRPARPLPAPAEARLQAAPQPAAPAAASSSTQLYPSACRTCDISALP